MRKSLIAAGLLGSTLLASAALAQTSPAPAPQPSATTSGSSQFITQLPPGTMLVSDLMDEDILSADNKDIGDVEDVVLDRNGRVVALVVEVEEGIGDRTVALPLSAFQMNAADATTTGSVQTGNSAARNDDDMRIIVNMSVDQLKAAPEFDDDND